MNAFCFFLHGENKNSLCHVMTSMIFVFSFIVQFFCYDVSRNDGADVVTF